MNVYVQELRSDHQRLSRLLNFLRDYLPSVQPGRNSIEIRPLRQCVEYIRAYSVEVHQQREDILFQRLAARDEDARIYVDVLTAEHRLLVHNAKDLHEIAIRVEKGRNTQREQLIRAAREFINTKIRHMRLEEDTVFPMVENQLTLDDWKRVISEMPTRRDPLFDDDRNDKYTPLRTLVRNHGSRVPVNGT